MTPREEFSYSEYCSTFLGKGQLMKGKCLRQPKLLIFCEEGRLYCHAAGGRRVCAYDGLIQEFTGHGRLSWDNIGSSWVQGHTAGWVNHKIKGTEKWLKGDQGSREMAHWIRNLLRKAWGPEFKSTASLKKLVGLLRPVTQCWVGGVVRDQRISRLAGYLARDPKTWWNGLEQDTKGPPGLLYTHFGIPSTFWHVCQIHRSLCTHKHKHIFRHKPKQW